MFRLTLLGLLWAGRALAQNNHATGAFHYVGCVEITAATAHEVPLDPQNCTPEACQQACDGYQFAAVHTTTCKCYNNVDAETQLSEEKCENWCAGDPSRGRCGSCKNDAYGNLYGCEPVSFSPDSVPPSTTLVIPPYSAAPVSTSWAPKGQPHTSTSCVTIVSTPYVPAPSPAGPVQTYGPQSSQTIVVQETPSTWTSTTRTSTSTSSTSTSTSTSTWSTSFTSQPGYSPPPASPATPQPKPGGYGEPVPPPPATVQGTSVVGQTPGGYGSGAPTPATPNPGYTSTKTGTHPHSSGTGTAEPSATVAAGAGAVSGSLFAVVLGLGVAVGLG